MTFYLVLSLAVLVIVSFGACVAAAIKMSGSERDDHESLDARALRLD